MSDDHGLAAHSRADQAVEPGLDDVAVADLSEGLGLHLGPRATQAHQLDSHPWRRTSGQVDVGSVRPGPTPPHDCHPEKGDRDPDHRLGQQGGAHPNRSKPVQERAG